MTKDEAIAIIARKLAPKYGETLTWAQFVDAVTGLTADEKATLVGLVRRQNAEGIGNMLLGQVRAHVRTLAVTEATTMLADDALSLAELDKVL